MKNKIVMVLVAFIFAVSISYGIWHIKRWFNYSFGYESQVRSSICEMINPEALRDPSDCKR